MSGDSLLLLMCSGDSVAAFGEKEKKKKEGRVRGER